MPFLELLNGFRKKDTALNLSRNDKEQVRRTIIDAGFDACGFATVSAVAPQALQQYSDWIKAGKHHTMHYLAEHNDVRENPALLLHDAHTIIAVALNYYPQEFQPKENPQFAYYAYGADYHKTIKKRLTRIAKQLASQYGGNYRACVDTAPLRERYWAQQAGIGFIGRNNTLIIPDKGSFFFLGFLLTTLDIEPDEPCTAGCIGCGKCITACPTSALSAQGATDARRCLSCLTIEHREELPDNISLGNRIYGCDTCQIVCPHNAQATPTRVPEFALTDGLRHLTADNIDHMTQKQYDTIFAHSAIKRASLQQLKRNLQHLKK